MHHSCKLKIQDPLTRDCSFFYRLRASPRTRPRHFGAEDAHPSTTSSFLATAYFCATAWRLNVRSAADAQSARHLQ
eukprot:9494220-Pyramimonas_sp.AAC.1